MRPVPNIIKALRNSKAAVIAMKRIYFLQRSFVIRDGDEHPNKQEDSSTSQLGALKGYKARRPKTGYSKSILLPRRKEGWVGSATVMIHITGILLPAFCSSQAKQQTRLGAYNAQMALLVVQTVIYTYIL